MVSEMYDILPWSSEVNTVLVLTTVIVGFVILTALWKLTRFRVWARGVAPSTTPTKPEVLNPRNLFFELKAVTNWYQLGINLGLQTYELNKIQRDYGGNDQQTLQTLDLWLRHTPSASWLDVLNALEEMGENRVAENIRQKYIRSGTQSIQEDSGTVGITRKNKQKIHGKFAKLLMNVCRKLREKPIDMNDLEIFFKGLFPEGCIPKCSNISEIFKAISDNKLWDYWNYGPLEELLKGVAASDQEIASWITTYKQDLKSYKETTKLIDFAHSVSIIVDEQPARYNQQYYKRLSFKLKMKFTDHSLSYIDDLWNECADLYGLPSYVALLDSLHEGCVSIVWLIPSHLAPQIFSVAPHNGVFYHKHEITRVEFDGKSLYQEKKEHIEVSEGDQAVKEELMTAMARGDGAVKDELMTKLTTENLALKGRMKALSEENQELKKELNTKIEELTKDLVRAKRSFQQKIQDMQETQDRKMNRLQNEHHQDLSLIRSSMVSCVKIPFDQRMTNFAERKSSNNPWYSEPFTVGYYKFGLVIFANGSGPHRGTHVSIYAHLMEGSISETAPLPVEGEIVVVLMNQLGGRGNKSVDVPLSREVPSIQRTTPGTDLVSHEELNYRTERVAYLHNDQLHLRIVDFKPAPSAATKRGGGWFSWQ